jgi:hypothetical protein
VLGRMGPRIFALLVLAPADAAKVETDDDGTHVPVGIAQGQKKARQTEQDLAQKWLLSERVSRRIARLEQPDPNAAVASAH